MSMSRTTRAITHAARAGALAVSLLSARASADAVPPPSTDCPAGSQGDSCHGGAYCAPATCTKSSDCTDGAVCQPTSLCVAEIGCYGGVVVGDGGSSTFPEQNVLGPCSDGACGGDAGATCTSLSVCVSPGGSSSGGTDVQGGCSCEAIGRSSGSMAMTMFALAAVGLGLVSRRRPPQRASRQRRE